MSDPIMGAIIAGVLWFFIGGAIEVIIYIIGFGIAAANLDKHTGASLVAIVSTWLVGIAWGVFVLIQVIIQIVRLIQLLTGAAV